MPNELDIDAIEQLRAAIREERDNSGSYDDDSGLAAWRQATNATDAALAAVEQEMADLREAKERLAEREIGELTTVEDTMATTMRAKMYVESVLRHTTVEVLTMRAVPRSDSYPEDGSDEDNTYAKFSPSGSIELTVANPALIGKINPGEKYYIDFTPVPLAGRVTAA